VVYPRAKRFQNPYVYPRSIPLAGGGRMFWTSFLARFSQNDTQDLPLSARVVTLEGDMLAMRAAVDKNQSTLRRMSGKVYRGVALGDTADTNPAPPPEGPELVPEHPDAVGKASLYQRAAQLRRR